MPAALTIPPSSPTKQHMPVSPLARPASAQAQAALDQHLSRLRDARTKAMLSNGKAAAQLAASDRRMAAARVELRVKNEAAKRRAELAAAYGRTKPPASLRPRPPNSDGHGLVLSSELLGEGATAKVWLGKFGPHRTEVAAKVVRKADLTAEQLGWIREEIHIHKQLRHPHICTMHGALEDAHTITMVLSLCKGSNLSDTMGRALETDSPCVARRPPTNAS